MFPYGWSHYLGAGSYELGWALAGIAIGALLQGLAAKR